jgi:hypothetical protein
VQAVAVEAAQVAATQALVMELMQALVEVVVLLVTAVALEVLVVLILALLLEVLEVQAQERLLQMNIILFLDTNLAVEAVVVVQRETKLRAGQVAVVAQPVFSVAQVEMPVMLIQTLQVVMVIMGQRQEAAAELVA